MLHGIPLLIVQSCPTLCYPMDRSLPGSSVHGILQAEYWSGQPFTSLGEISDPEIEPRSLLCRQIFYHLSPQESLAGPKPNQKPKQPMLLAALRYMCVSGSQRSQCLGLSCCPSIQGKIVFSCKRFITF